MVAEQADNVEKVVKEKHGKEAKKAEKKSNNRSLDSWVVQLIALSVICFSLFYFLMELFYLKPLDSKYQTQLTSTQIKSIEVGVSRYFKEQIRWVNTLVNNDVIDETLVAQVLKKTKPELREIQIISLDNLNQISSQEGLSFASIDLLRRAAKGEKTQVEAFLQEAEWLFQIAALNSSDSGLAREGRVLLAVFDLSALQNILQKAQRTMDGNISIQVRGINKPVLQLGSGSGINNLSIPTSVDDWSVSYSPDLNVIQAADRTLLYLVLVSVLVIFIFMLMMIFRVNINAIKRDIQRAAQLITKSMDAESQFQNNFHFGEVFSMANAVVSQARQIITKYKKQPVKVNDKTPAAQSEPDDEPLFDDDLFDIDALEPSASENSTLFEDSEGQGALVEEKEMLDVDVSQAIFRAYDIRGIVDETLSPAIVELLGKAIATEALAQGQKTLCIGYDGRLSSKAYSEALTRGVISTGMDAILIGEVPTPVLYFATHHFETGSGVMITGSHNPSNYNGFKMMIAGHTLSGEAIQKLYNRINMQDFTQGQGKRSEQSISRQYIDTILNDIAVAAPLKVVIDAGNGVAGGIAPDLIEELGCEVIPLHCEVDGTFPNHHPDPGKPENLQDLIAAVKEHNADIGLAFDGDGDRIGVVTNTGKIIWPDRLLMLFAKDVVSRNPGADIIYDVKCSRRLNALISSYGGRPVMWKTGHSLIKSKMKETGALLAGEMSGHVFFKERWFGFDDGLYSAARLLEILGVEDKTSDEVFAEFPEDVSTPEINVEVSDESKFSIVEKLCARKEQFVGGNVSTIDGLRVDYPNGWGLCRASNTTPVLVLRFEADDESSLAEIKAKFVLHLKDIDPSINCDF